MNGIFAQVHLYPLQTVKYFKDDDPASALQIGIIVGAIVLILIIARLVRSKGRSSKGGKALTGFAPRRMFSRFALSRIASEYGLNREQKRLLDYILRHEGAGDPEKLVQNADSLDRIFKNVVKAFERSAKSEDQLQQHLAKLYTLRNIMDIDAENSADSSSEAPSQRRFRRKQIHSPCTVFMVNERTVKKGRKKTTKLVVDGRKSYKGTMHDISIGGCAINTPAPVQGNSTLKIDFYCYGDSMISVLGKVVRSNRTSSTGTVIHIKFIKTPRRAFNEINSLIFGYD